MPDLPQNLELYWRAFQDLSTERQIGMAVGNIPWSAIEKYGEKLGMDADGIETLHYHIRNLEAADHEYEKSQDKKAPRK